MFIRKYNIQMIDQLFTIKTPNITKHLMWRQDTNRQLEIRFIIGIQKTLYIETLFYVTMLSDIPDTT